MNTLLIFIPLLPLLGFIFCGTLGKRFPRLVVGAVATGCVTAAFVLAAILFGAMVKAPVEERTFHTTLWNWIAIPGAAKSLSLDVTLLLDPLSITRRPASG